MQNIFYAKKIILFCLITFKVINIFSLNLI